MRNGKNRKKQRSNEGRQAFFISAKPKRPKGKRGRSIATIWANKRDDGSEYFSISWFTRDKNGRETGPHEVDPDRYFYNVVPIEPDDEDEEEQEDEEPEEDEDEGDEDEDERPRRDAKRGASSKTSGKKGKAAAKGKARGADDDLLDGLDEDEEDDEEAD